MTDIQKAITVAVDISNGEDILENLNELKGLAEACGIEVISEFTQNLDRFNPKTYLGPGKLLELKELIVQEDIDLVIFDDELSPTQLRNIDEILEVEILDRTGLILEIFESRAKTKEAMLQVERAKMKYMLPRLIGANKNLGRQSGGSGVRNRGAGETKLELDRRIVEKRISDINKQLKDLKVIKEEQRKRRDSSSIPQVALVGYTNAGKSTLMNSILENIDSDKSVFEKDMLFATLDTTTRRIEFDDNRNFVLSDTVGFVNKIPNELLKSFETTLSEVLYADLILHVIDASDDASMMHKDLTESTLSKIGVEDIPTVYIYNKIDKTESEARIDNDTIYMSAKSESEVSDLIEYIQKTIYNNYIDIELDIPYNDGNIVSEILDNSIVISKANTETGTHLHIKASDEEIKKYNKYKTKVR